MVHTAVRQPLATLWPAVSTIATAGAQNNAHVRSGLESMSGEPLVASHFTNWVLPTPLVLCYNPERLVRVAFVPMLYSFRL